MDSVSTGHEDALAAADTIREQIRELARGGYQVEFQILRSEGWRPITEGDVRVDGIMLRIEGETGTVLCSPTQFSAAFRRVTKLAVVP